MSPPDRTRRGLSRRSVIGGGATLLPLVSLLGLVGPSTKSTAAARTPELRQVDRHQAQCLIAICRTLFPHDLLSDDYYMDVVRTIDAKASTNTVIADTIASGLAQVPPDFSLRSEARREAYLRGIEGSAFFGLIYQETITGLYGNPAVSALFGGEGSSVEHGGYLERGFDDLDWLPANA